MKVNFEFSRLRWRLLSLYVLTPVLVLNLILAGIFWKANHTPQLELPPPHVEQGGVAIFYNGYVVPAGVDMLREIYAKRDPVKAVTFMMNSRGGDGEAAAEIAKFLTDNNLVFVAMNGDVCISACTLIYMDTARSVAQDHAIFMFHSARYFMNPFQKILLHIGLLSPPAGQVEIMMRRRLLQTWPKLAEFFAGCDVDPKTTEDGMYLSGQELNSILAGTFIKTCKELPAHDEAWAEEIIQSERARASLN